LAKGIAELAEKMERDKRRARLDMDTVLFKPAVTADESAHNEWVESLSEEEQAKLRRLYPKVFDDYLRCGIAPPIPPCRAIFWMLMANGFSIAAPDAPIYTGGCHSES
jgi:hypothetical protein